jgi:hypothetical protein
MRVSRFQQQHLLVLNQEEAQHLADACALLIYASCNARGCKLPPHTSSVLSKVFTALAQDHHEH